MKFLKKYGYYTLIILALILSVSYFISSNNSNTKADSFVSIKSNKSFRYAINNDGKINYIVTDDFSKFSGLPNAKLIKMPSKFCTDKGPDNNNFKTLVINSSLVLAW